MGHYNQIKCTKIKLYINKRCLTRGFSIFVVEINIKYDSSGRGPGAFIKF